MVSRGMLTFITGGTSRAARLVEYDDARWARSVRCKSAILAAHGVGVGSRVAVCHPFAPWAIGQVHVDGALACGADVFPFGLNVSNQEVQDLLFDVRPTHLCGGARNLLRLAADMQRHQRLPALPPEGALFVAGEALSLATRLQCEEVWNVPVVNVYGMAEFDALGAELPGRHGLWLLDEFEFAVCVGDEQLEPAAGLIGTLAVRGRGDVVWHQSGDIVEVLPATNPPDGFSCAVAIVGRHDLVVNFADGSAISEVQVQQLLQKVPELAALQVQVFSPDDQGEIVRVVCVPRSPVNTFDHARIRNLMENINVDVADSFRAGIIRDFMIDVYPTERALIETARGKRPLLLRMG